MPSVTTEPDLSPFPPTQSAESAERRWFTRISIWEGWSFLILLGIAMPLKYLAGWPHAVLVVGSAHGALWVVYLVALAIVWQKDKWPFTWAFLGGVASVLPLGPWWFKSWLAKTEA